MTGYILNPDMEPVKVVEISSYDVPIESAQGDTGTVIVLNDVSDEHIGDFIELEAGGKHYALRIESIADGDDNSTALTVGDGVSAFTSMQVVMVLARTEEADENYVLSGDDYDHLLKFACSYESISIPPYYYKVTSSSIDRFGAATTRFNGLVCCGKIDSSTTMRNNYALAAAWFESLGFTMSDIQAEKLWSLGTSPLITTCFLVDRSKLIRLIQSLGYKATAELSSDIEYVPGTQTLICDVKRCAYINFEPTQLPKAVVYFNDGHAELQSESYETDIISCVAVLKRTVYEYDYFSLLADGTISQGTAPDQNRIRGSYKVILAMDSSAEDYMTPLEQATEIFSQNVRSHQVTFVSDKEYHLGQPMTLMLKRGTLETKISSVKLSSEDNRWLYTCGDLPQTIAEKINAQKWKYIQRIPSQPKKGTLVVM